MPERVADETTVDDSYSVTVPAAVRRRAGIEAGDDLRWTVDGAGTLSVDLVKQRVGVFEDFEPVSMGGDGATAHDHGCGTVDGTRTARRAGVDHVEGSSIGPTRALPR